MGLFEQVKSDVKKMEVPPMELYAIRDLKTAYAPPVAVSNRDAAIRWFARLMKTDATMSFSPGDFDLYYVGLFDTKTGQIVQASHELICNGKEYEK